MIQTPDINPDYCEWPECDCTEDDCCDGMAGLCCDELPELPLPGD